MPSVKPGLQEKMTTITRHLKSYLYYVVATQLATTKATHEMLNTEMQQVLQDDDI